MQFIFIVMIFLIITTGNTLVVALNTTPRESVNYSNTIKSIVQCCMLYSCSEILTAVTECAISLYTSCWVT